MIAIVRSHTGDRQRGFLAVTLGTLLGAVELAQDCPDFCSSHALGLSLSISAALAGCRYLLSLTVAPSLICDGEWLAYRSWLLGSLVDLHDLAEVHAHASPTGAPSEILLCARQRELYRLQLRQWRDEDVRELLSALLDTHPGMKLDGDTWAWLGHARGR